MASIAGIRLTWRHLVLASAAALAAGIVATFLPEYALLGQQMTVRYAEKENSAAADARMHAAMQQQAEAEAARQAAAEEAARRLALQRGPLVSEFKAIGHTHTPPLITLAKNLDGAIEAMRKAASRPDFYGNGYVKPEETASGVACSDPAGTLELWNRDARRDKNIYACSIYLALHPHDGGPVKPKVTMALLQRVNDAAEDGHYPFQSIVAFIWLQHLAEKVNNGIVPDPLPPINVGESYNPALFHGELCPGFAQRFIETATNAEKLSLAQRVYPDLQRMAQLAPQIVQACKLTQQTDCLSTADTAQQ